MPAADADASSSAGRSAVHRPDDRGDGGRSDRDCPEGAAVFEYVQTGAAASQAGARAVGP